MFGCFFSVVTEADGLVQMKQPALSLAFLESHRRARVGGHERQALNKKPRAKKKKKKKKPQCGS